MRGCENRSGLSGCGRTTFWPFLLLVSAYLVQVTNCAHITDTSETRLCRLRLMSWHNQRWWMSMILTMATMEYGPRQSCSITLVVATRAPKGWWLKNHYYQRILSSMTSYTVDKVLCNNSESSLAVHITQSPQNLQQSLYSQLVYVAIDS